MFEIAGIFPNFFQLLWISHWMFVVHWYYVYLAHIL